jgi:hypothetical protein
MYHVAVHATLIFFMACSGKKCTLSSPICTYFGVNRNHELAGMFIVLEALPRDIFFLVYPNIWSVYFLRS